MNKEKLQEVTMLALSGKLTESIEDDMRLVIKSLESNNIPYQIKKDKIILDYDNKAYNKAHSTDKDDIMFDNNGKVYVSCWVKSSYIDKYLNENEKKLFHSQGQSVINSKGWVDLNDNIVNIIATFKAANKAYKLAQENVNNESTNYLNLAKYVKPLIDTAFDEKYSYNNSNADKIKTYCKDEAFIKSIIDFIKSVI